MIDLSKLTSDDWKVIQAGTGPMRDSLAFDIDAILRKAGMDTREIVTRDSIPWICRALHWENRADEFSAKAAEHSRYRHEQEKYVQELFDENERLKNVCVLALEDLEQDRECKAVDRLSEAIRKSE